MKVVIEHVSAISDYDEEGYEDCWLVVAYLDLEGQQRQRVTMHRFATHDEAAVALEGIWDRVAAGRSKGENAA